MVPNMQAAHAVCAFYENPDHVGPQDDLQRLGLLQTVQQHLPTVLKFDIDTFVKNERWSELSQNIDQCLPSIIVPITDSIIPRIGDILRSVNVSVANQSLYKVSIKTGNTEWYNGPPTDIPSFPLLCYNADTVVNPGIIDQCVQTFLPPTIARKLRRQNLIIVPVGHDEDCTEFYLTNGNLYTV